MFDFIYHRGPLVIHVPLGQTAYRAVETTAIPEDRDAVKLKSLKYFLFKIIFDGWNFDSNMKNYILHLGYSFKKTPSICSTFLCIEELESYTYLKTCFF